MGGVFGAFVVYLITAHVNIEESIAATAALISAVTLVFVLVQIGLAERALRLARLEFKVVKDDLAFSREQVAYLNRRAVLTLSHGRQKIDTCVMLVQEQAGKSEVRLRLWLLNTGSRTAQSARILLWFPLSWSAPGWESLESGSPARHFEQEGFKYDAVMPLQGKQERFWHVTLDVQAPTYPRMPHLVHEFRMAIPVGSKDQILWRVGCDDGTYPPGEAEGRLRVYVQSKTNTEPP